MFKIGAAFALSRSKTTTRRQFRGLFATVYCIHYFTPVSNQQLAEWAAANESCPKRPKTQTSTGKVLAPVLWDAQGILFIDCLEKGRTINNEYYIALLVRLKEEIAKKKRP